MTHLGSQLSALADGRLDPVARERALCHVAACPACADELAATRAARRALADAGDVPVAPDLAARLLALGSTGVAGDTAHAGPAGHGEPRGSARSGEGFPPPGGAGPAGAPFGAGRRTLTLDGAGFVGVERLGDLGGRRLSVRTAAVVVTGALAVGLFTLGDPRHVVPDSHPANDLALLAGAVPAVTDAAAGPELTPDDAWLGALPAGYAVVAHSSDAAGSEIDLSSPAGAVVVLREQGRLSDAVLRSVPTTTIGAREVHVLSHSPWHAVWQSGDAVVGVVAAHRPAAEPVVAAYPSRAADDGVGARLSRGWQTVVGAWSP